MQERFDNWIHLYFVRYDDQFSLYVSAFIAEISQHSETEESESNEKIIIVQSSCETCNIIEIER